MKTTRTTLNWALLGALAAAGCGGASPDDVADGTPLDASVRVEDGAPADAVVVDPDATAGDAGCGGVDRLFPGPCERASQAAGADPVPVRTFAYDAAGRVVRDLTHRNDGRPDHDERWRFDAAGNLVEQSEYSGDRLMTGMVCTHAYVDGRLVLSECDGGPGGPDGTLEDRVSRTYDANGWLVMVEADGEPPFEAPDGVPDSRISFAYDAAGHLLTNAQDFEADGDTDRLTTHVWDADGHHLRETIELTVEGAEPPIRRMRLTEWTYDAAGRVLSERTEDTGDDVWDYEHEFTWDAEGRPLTERVTYMGSDGPYHVDIVYTYDERGRRARVESTGTDGSTGVTEYVYDAAGHLRETRTTAQGPMGGDVELVPTITVETYDCAGNVLRLDEDQGQDGSVDRSELNRYDDACWPRE
jgi:hypothetical protein